MSFLHVIPWTKSTTANRKHRAAVRERPATATVRSNHRFQSKRPVSSRCDEVLGEHWATNQAKSPFIENGLFVN